ncbi:AAA family ATPase [Pseudomonas sp. NY15435]|uniref:AAA family ATPase n=1 Tax=Pseudomonas sp. NY15435 TaxID=3400358 RepID=UPI003A8BA54C
MDESKLLLGNLFRHINSLEMRGSLGDQVFRIVVLYFVADQVIDWSSEQWGALRRKHESEQRLLPEDSAWILIERCGGSRHLPDGNLPSFQELHERLSYMGEQLDRYEWRALFDSLFYNIIGESGYDRTHAEIGGALAGGLAKNHDLIDLDAYCGEALIEHLRLYGGGFGRHLVQNKLDYLDIILLRLHVWDVDFELIDGRAAKLDEETLALLDIPTDGYSPFGGVLERLSATPCRGRLLLLFTSRMTSDPTALRELRELLLEGDLLEAVFDFNSFNAKGRPVRSYAWLLNAKKRHADQTLCIDIRGLPAIASDATHQNLAAFAAATCTTWASNKPDLALALGPLNGLFAQLFDGGYQDIEGLCKVLPSSQVIKASIASRRVPPAKRDRELSLLDRRPLLPLLGRAGESPSCIYIIGNNGVGKSLLLASLVPYLQQKEIRCSAIAVGGCDRFPLSDSELYPSYSYLGDKTGKSSSPKSIERKLIRMLIKLVRMYGRPEVFDKVLDEVDIKQRVYLAPESIFSGLQLPSEELARRVVPISEARRAIVPLKNMCLALSRRGTSDLVRFIDLSSGEQQLLHLFARIIYTATPGEVLLIDEPEISLHVRWQQVLPSLFSSLAQELRCQFVIATHSPTLVANASDSQSQCFLAKKQQLHAIAPQHRHSVETILLEGFETYTPHNREVAERCAALVGEAIRVSNSADADHASAQSSLVEALERMQGTMASFANKDDQRFQQDQNLIEQARLAIAETFNLAATVGQV